MRVVSPGAVGVVLAAAATSVLLSACDLREGDGTEYGNSSGGYGPNIENVIDQKSLDNSIVVE